MNTVKKINQIATHREIIYIKIILAFPRKKYISYFDISWNEYTITR